MDNNWRELPIGLTGLGIDQVIAFLQKAKEAGCNEMEIRLERGYYDSVDAVALLVSNNPARAYAEENNIPY